MVVRFRFAKMLKMNTNVWHFDCCYTDSCNTSYINLGNESITHAHNHGFGRKNKGPRNKLTSLNTTFTAVLEHNKKKKTAKLD